MVAVDAAMFSPIYEHWATDKDFVVNLMHVRGGN